MMQAYRTEGNYRSAARLSAAELRAAMASHEILQATALAFDTQRQLRFDLGGIRAVMPFVQCADGAENGTVRDIAVLTRVGRPPALWCRLWTPTRTGSPSTGFPAQKRSGCARPIISIPFLPAISCPAP